MGPSAYGIDFKIATITYKVVHLKQPLSLVKLIKHKFMHLHTGHNDQLLLQHPLFGANSYGYRAFSYTVHTVYFTVSNKLPYFIHNAPSVILFTKKIKNTILKFLQAVSSMVRKFHRFLHCRILTLVNESGFISRF